LLKPQHNLRFYIDIAHPAHAHALRYFMSEMQQRGHILLVTARDKDITHCLLNAWGIDFIDRGPGKSGKNKGNPGGVGIFSLAGKTIYLARVTARLLPQVRKFNPDAIVSWCSYHAALIGRILGKPVLTFEDTEDVPLLHGLNRLLSSRMITPFCFEKDFGKKHIRFHGYKELASLHPSRFEKLPIPDYIRKPYILLRFVAWTAYHDRGHTGITEQMKVRIAGELSEQARVYISSETPLPPSLEKYSIPVGCEMVHSLMAQASLFFSESASMAAEAAVLGVPAIFIDNTGRGYTRDLETKYGLLFSFREDRNSVQAALDLAVELMRYPTIRGHWKEKQRRMLDGKPDLPLWMADLAERTVSGGAD
jgi:uncharacterized protein